MQTRLLETIRSTLRIPRQTLIETVRKGLGSEVCYTNGKDTLCIRSRILQRLKTTSGGSVANCLEGLLLDDDELRHCVTRCQIIPVRHGPTINRKPQM
jgi:hypothetical protein